MSRSGGPLWPGKPGRGSGGRKGENKATEVDGVTLLQEEAGELTRSGGPLWPGKPGARNGKMRQERSRGNGRERELGVAGLYGRFFFAPTLLG